MRPPQSPQNQETTSAPDGDSPRHAIGEPRTIRKAWAETGMFSAKALPERRWQSVQWQAYSSRG
jgi:hypothetical protein